MKKMSTSTTSRVKRQPARLRPEDVASEGMASGGKKRLLEEKGEKGAKKFKAGVPPVAAPAAPPVPSEEKPAAPTEIGDVVPPADGVETKTKDKKKSKKSGSGEEKPKKP